MDRVEVARTSAVAERWRVRDALQDAVAECLPFARTSSDGPSADPGTPAPCRARLSATVRAYASCLRTTGVSLPDILPEVNRLLASVIQKAGAAPDVGRTLTQWCTEAYVGPR